jgi:hypothetical protein
MIVLVSFCALGLAAAPPTVGANELPTSWRLDEIRKAASADPDCRAYVLAWKAVQDERPLRVETCLVLTVHSNDDGSPYWRLSHLYRHPLAKKPEWELSMTHVFDRNGGLWFIHCAALRKPSNKEIYASLDFANANWSFAHEKGWEVLDCRVCEKTWRQVVGEKPTKFFPKRPR